MDLLAPLVQLGGAADEIVVAGAQVAAQHRDVLLLRGDDLDELFLVDELVEHHRIDGGAVLLVLLDEQVLRVREAAQQVVDLHLEPLDLDFLLVQLVVD